MLTSTLLCVCILILLLFRGLSDIAARCGMPERQLAFLAIVQLAMQEFTLTFSSEFKLCAAVIGLPIYLALCMPRRLDAYYPIPILLLCFGPIAAFFNESPLILAFISGLSGVFLIRSPIQSRLLGAALMPIAGAFFRAAFDILLNHYTNLFLEQTVMDAQIAGLCITLILGCIPALRTKAFQRI